MTNLYGLQKKRKKITAELKRCDRNKDSRKIDILLKAREKLTRQIEKARKPKKVFQVINGKGKNR